MGEVIKVPFPEPRKAPEKEREDPTEWRPKDNSDYYEETVEVRAQEMRSAPWRYGSLAEEPVAGIEMNALAQLRQVMNHAGMHPDERTLRVRWMLVAEGYGYKAPKGFIHPEAPEDIQRQSQAAWKRCVEFATDSLSKTIFVRVWRRRQRAVEAPERKAIEP